MKILSGMKTTSRALIVYSKGKDINLNDASGGCIILE